MTPQGTSDLTFRFHDSSLDPYVRLFVPKLSPYTTAVASGSIRVAGELSDVDRLLVDATVDASRCGCSTTRSATRRRSGSRSTSTSSASRICASSATTPSSTSAARSQLHDQRIALRASGDANLRHPPGILPRRARLGPRRAGRRGRRSAVRAGVFRQRHDRRRPRPPLLAAQLARCDQRRDSVRLARPPARRRDGDDGRRPRPVRRPHRLRRLPARRAERHRARRRTCTCAIPRASAPRSTPTCRSAATSRRRSSAARSPSRTRSGPGGSIRPAACSISAAARIGVGDPAVRRAAGGRGHAAVPLRFDIEVHVPVDAADREQPGPPGGERRPAAARHLRSAAAVRPRRGRSRRGDVRGAPLSRDARRHRLHQPDADRAVLRRRGRNAGARARARPTGSPCARPARWSGCSPSSAPIRRCRPPTCWRCSSATCAATRSMHRAGRGPGRRAARAAEPERAAARHPDDARHADARQPDLRPRSAGSSSRPSASTPSSSRRR